MCVILTKVIDIFSEFIVFFTAKESFMHFYVRAQNIGGDWSWIHKQKFK